MEKAMDDSFESDLTIRNCMFAFKCTAQWEELTPTNDSKINFCRDCQKDVHLCEDDDELVTAVRLNRCVAIYREEESGFSGLTLGDVVIRD